VSKRSNRRSVPKAKVWRSIAAETGRTMSEWFRLLDGCGRSGVKSSENVSWLKKRFGLTNAYASAIQRGTRRNARCETALAVRQPC
jgi:hypothetical protein